MAKKRAHISSKSDVPTKITRTVLQETEEVGIIVAVVVKNFMCHDHLHFKFGSNINFIKGENGSGKSAILTAIVIGLGGKSYDTGRGKNLGSYVKTGKHLAEISVTLQNCGPDAYKPEVYGSFIKVVRRIKSQGISSYKLMSENDNVISTKKKDLDHILDNFNIQINNPVSVLNQEESRIFLSSKGNKEKYKFFFRATQLEQLKQDYTLAEEQKRVTEDILKKKEKNLPELEKEVKALEIKWKFHQSLEEHHEKIEKLKCEFSWAYIIELEKEKDEKLKQLETVKNANAKLVQEIETDQAFLKNLKEEKEKLYNKLRDIDCNIEEHQLKHQNTNNNLEIKKNELRKIEFALQRQEYKILNKSKELKGLQDKIEDIRNGDHANKSDEKRKRLEAIHEYQQNLNQFEAERKTTEVHKKNLEGSVTNYNKKLFDLRQGVKLCDEQYIKGQKALDNLEYSRTNSLRCFGRFTPELLEQLEIAYKKGRFLHKPRGPIGACIKLTDSKWALAVESCLKSLLFSFCCDNYKDQQVLQHIMKTVIKNDRKPSIITSKFTNQVYDTRKLAVKTQSFPTILKILVCDDPVIINCLIDQKSIEKILLIEKNSEARQVMLNNVPQHCRGAYTLYGDELFPFPFRYYSCKKQKVEYLHGSVEEMIREKKAEIKGIHDRGKGLMKEVNEISVILQSNKNDLINSETHLRNLSQHINSYSLKLEELQNYEETESVDVKSLIDEVIMLEAEKENDEKIKQEKQKECKEAKLMYENQLFELSSINNDLSSLWNVYEQCKQSLNELDTEEERKKSNKKFRESQLINCQLKESSYQNKYDEAFQTLQLQKKKAEEISPRIDTIRSPHNIEAEIRQVEQYVRNQEKNYGSKEEVESKYVETRKRFSKIKKEINSLAVFLKKFNCIMKQRLENFCHIRQQLSLRVKYLFNNTLSMRQYVGKIVFDHDKELLNIKVQPNNNLERLNDDMGSLSGGERSFTTVSFMLSLWGCVETPFRILDEFEVYMDMVNRQVTMDMILDTCSRKRKAQFIFLSPLEMTKMEKSPLIIIHTMPKPARDKTSLHNDRSIPLR